MTKQTNYHRYPGEYKETSQSQFASSGIVKWCALCGTHKPQTGGFIRMVMGGRHWVCAKHPRPTPKK
jgi:hypothetical protein